MEWFRRSTPKQAVTNIEKKRDSVENESNEKTSDSPLKNSGPSSGSSSESSVSVVFIFFCFFCYSIATNRWKNAEIEEIFQLLVTIF